MFKQCATSAQIVIYRGRHCRGQSSEYPNDYLPNKQYRIITSLLHRPTNGLQELWNYHSLTKKLQMPLVDDDHRAGCGSATNMQLQAFRFRVHHTLFIDNTHSAFLALVANPSFLVFSLSLNPHSALCLYTILHDHLKAHQIPI